jgi:hypothetical protein
MSVPRSELKNLAAIAIRAKRDGEPIDVRLTAEIPRRVVTVKGVKPGQVIYDGGSGEQTWPIRDAIKVPAEVI